MHDFKCRFLHKHYKVDLLWAKFYQEKLFAVKNKQSLNLGLAVKVEVCAGHPPDEQKNNTVLPLYKGLEGTFDIAIIEYTNTVTLLIIIQAK